MMATTEGRDRSRERSFSGNHGSNRTRSTNNSRSRSGSRATTNRDRIRCYNCGEYDHFVRDCPTSWRRKRYRSITTNANSGRRTNPFIN